MNVRTAAFWFVGATLWFPLKAGLAADNAPAATILGVTAARHGYCGGGSPLDLSLAWQFPQAGTKAAEELDGALVLSSPAVVGDAVYVATCVFDLRKSFGAVLRLDARTGQMRWMTTTFKDAKGKTREFRGFFSSPAITADGKHLVIGQGLHTDDHCELVCLETATGRVKWVMPSPLHIEGSPAIEGDVVVAGSGAIETEGDRRAKGHPGLVFAVRISTGEKLWEYQVNDPESSPLLLDGITYVGSGFNGNAVVALRGDNEHALRRGGLKRVLWQTATKFPVAGPVTLAGDALLVACGNGDYVNADRHPQGAVVALDRATGKVRWQWDTADSVLGRIAVQGDTAMVPVRNGELLALRLTDPPRELWRQRLSGGKALLAGPAFTGKYVYTVTQDGNLAVLDAESGGVVERLPLNAANHPGDMGLSVSSPTVALGRVFVGSETGGLRCLRGRVTKE